MLLLKQLYGIDESAFKNRDPGCMDTDIAVVRAIAQAALEVELFTIPLYMTTLYSIQGFHQINQADNNFYVGRQWPGMATTANPKETENEANAQAFNIIMSVFVQEMLHLQLAANMATTIGAQPDFTTLSPKDKNYGWTCYGPDKTIIPHIIDLQDTKKYDNVKVKVGPLDEETINLFIAIEEPEQDAKDFLKPTVPRGKYFPPKPISPEQWSKDQTLPMFGTIGYMYQYYAAYLQITYKDPKTHKESRLWDFLFRSDGAQQNDMFNDFVYPGHPMREYMGFESTIAQVYPDNALTQMIRMMDAICDQGEGATFEFKAGKLKDIARYQLSHDEVKEEYQSTLPALESDYPSYDQYGKLIPSADAAARFQNDSDSHYKRFLEIKNVWLSRVVTWPEWLKTHGPWKTMDFQCKSEMPLNPDLPSPSDTAQAMNELTKQFPYKLLSQVVIGAIAGVTTVLNDYWNAKQQKSSPITFPSPSMFGSGDRMAICWAVTGMAPDLSIGIDPPDANTLYHACQGLAWDYDGGKQNDCAAVAIFHTCRGSNGCHAQGGCGFVQPYGGGGSCSASATVRGTVGYMRRVGPEEAKLKGVQGTCGQTPQYQPTSDNKCKSFGGCAVPISAYQLFPIEGKMGGYTFQKKPMGGTYESVPIMPDNSYWIQNFAVGDSVHDVAYKIYLEAMKTMKEEGKPVNIPPDNPPPPNALRLVFPPST